MSKNILIIVATKLTFNIVLMIQKSYILIYRSLKNCWERANNKTDCTSCRLKVKKYTSWPSCLSSLLQYRQLRWSSLAWKQKQASFGLIWINLIDKAEVICGTLAKKYYGPNLIRKEVMNHAERFYWEGKCYIFQRKSWALVTSEVFTLVRVTYLQSEYSQY